MLITYVGLPGSGKSLFNSFVAYTELTRIMYTKGVLKRKWYQSKILNTSYYDWVVLNTDFDDGRGNFVRWSYDDKKWEYGGYCIGVNDIDEVYEKMNCLVLLDEAGTQLANTDWDKMPAGYRMFLTQHRKNITHLPMRFDIFVYTQHKDLIEITLRRLSYRIYLIRPLFGFAKNPLRPNFLSRIPGVKIYLYFRHEVLEGRAGVKLDDLGRPLPVSAEDQLESLERINWYIFGKKYSKAYDTLTKLQEKKRVKTSS